MDTFWRETVVATHALLGMTTRRPIFLWALTLSLIIVGQGPTEPHRSFIRLTVLGWGATLFAVCIPILDDGAYHQCSSSPCDLTIGEMFANPQIPAWIDHISDPNAKVGAQGLHDDSHLSLGRAVGPLYGSGNDWR